MEAGDVEDWDAKGAKADDAADGGAEKDDVEKDDDGVAGDEVEPCAVEVQVNMSQEPLYRAISRKHAAPHNRGPTCTATFHICHFLTEICKKNASPQGEHPDQAQAQLV